MCVCVCVSKNIAKPHFVSVSLCTPWPSYFKKRQEVSDVGFIISTCRLKRKIKYCLGLKTQGFLGVSTITSKYCVFRITAIHSDLAVIKLVTLPLMSSYLPKKIKVRFDFLIVVTRKCALLTYLLHGPESFLRS